jgi:hypothetical protein
LLALCDRHRGQTLDAMRLGLSVVPCPKDAPTFAAFLRSHEALFPLPDFRRLWEAMAAFDLGNVPEFPREPQAGHEAIAALDLVRAWCRAKIAESAGKNSPDSPHSPPPTGLEGLPLRVQRAWTLYQRGIEVRQDLAERGTDREVYDYLKDTLAGEVDGVRLPAFDTWQRYLRIARRALGGRKHEPRHGRPHGPSIVRADQI